MKPPTAIHTPVAIMTIHQTIYPTLAQALIPETSTLGGFKIGVVKAYGESQLIVMFLKKALAWANEVG